MSSRVEPCTGVRSVPRVPTVHDKFSQFAATMLCQRLDKHLCNLGSNYLQSLNCMWTRLVCGWRHYWTTLRDILLGVQLLADTTVTCYSLCLYSLVLSFVHVHAVWCDFQAPCGEETPLDIQCKIANRSGCAGNGCANEQVMSCKMKGLTCLHVKQPELNGEQCQCCDYKVRYLCPGMLICLIYQVIGMFLHQTGTYLKTIAMNLITIVSHVWLAIFLLS